MKEKRYKIRQRKPDVTQDESFYSTAIEDSEGMPIAIGHGFTQGGADTDALKRFIEEINN